MTNKQKEELKVLWTMVRKNGFYPFDMFVEDLEIWMEKVKIKPIKGKCASNGLSCNLEAYKRELGQF